MRVLGVVLATILVLGQPAVSLAQEPVCQLMADGSVGDLDDGSSFNMMVSPWRNEPLECWSEAAKAAGQQIWGIICSGYLPTDPQLEPTRASCQQMAAQVRSEFDCELEDGKGGTFATKCHSFFALQSEPNIPATPIDAATAYRRAFSGQPYFIAFEETASAREQRERRTAVEDKVADQGRSLVEPSKSDRARAFILALHSLSQKYPGGSSNQEYLSTELGIDTYDPTAVARSWEVPGNLLVCKDCDFYGMDFRRSALGFDVDLDYVSVEGARFFGVPFGAIDIWNANFSGADFSAAWGSIDFLNTYLSDATMGFKTESLNLQIAGPFERDGGRPQDVLRGADFGAIRVETLSVIGIPLRDALFSKARIDSLQLNTVDATGVDFSKAQIKGLAFSTDTSLQGANFSGMTMSFLPSDGIRSQTVLEGADLTGATINYNPDNAALANGLFGAPRFCNTRIAVGDRNAQRVEIIGTC